MLFSPSVLQELASAGDLAKMIEVCYVEYMFLISDNLPHE